MATSGLKTALVVGATGLIGDLLTHRLVESPDYDRVYVLTRRPLPWQHPRLQEIQFDFDHPNGLLIRADDIYCCLGTTISQAGSKDAFRKVDYQYPLDVARLGLANGASQFALVSSMGADATSAIFYNRVKGEIERDLMALNYPTLLIFRPSLLLGERAKKRVGELISGVFMRVFAPVIPAKYKAVSAEKVANAMLTTMQQHHRGHHIFESDNLQAY